jgi:uncharacterized protein (TIGR02145 family)
MGIKNIHYMSFIIFIYEFSVQAQQLKSTSYIEETIFQGDSICLEVTEFYGDIQWQKTNDLISWIDIDGATSGSVEFVADNSGYYRAKITAGICDPVYSDTILLYIDNGIDFNDQLTYGTVSDIDGNIYKTVQIDAQIWMAENLKATRYNDGTDIPDATVNWGSSGTPAYCWYNNNADTCKAVYGALYNWYAISTAANGGKNICPAGWHVPTDAEWQELEFSVGMDYELIDTIGFHGTNEGSKLKETGTTHWGSLTCFGTNESGFTGLPGGVRFYYGIFSSLGFMGFWWSSTEYYQPTEDAWYRSLHYDYRNICRHFLHKKSGISVRCLRDK